MKAFTIDTDNNITVHATRKAAGETGLSVFDSEESFAALIGPNGKRLLEIWNSITGVAPVRKFTNSKVGAKRIWNEIQKLKVDQAPLEAPAEAAAGKTVKATPAGKPKAAKKAKDAKPVGGSKKDIILALVARAEGATLEEIMAATAWQKHSVRGFISTLGSKHGYTITSTRREADKVRIYSITK